MRGSGWCVNDEKRVGGKAIPDNVEEYLNELQQAILLVVEKHGWTLKFVRHSLNESPVIVIEDDEGENIGVLENNGAINHASGIVVSE